MQTSPKWLFDYLFVIRRNRAFFPGRIFPAVANSWDTLKTISQTLLPLPKPFKVRADTSDASAGNKKKKFITHHKRQRYEDLKLFFIFHRVYGGVQLVNKRLTGSMQWHSPGLKSVWKMRKHCGANMIKKKKKVLKTILKWKRNFIVVEKDSKSKTVVQFHCCSCFLPFGNSFELSAITHHNKLSQYFGKQQKL